MIRPEIDHHLAQLPLGEHCAHDGDLLQLAAQLAELAHRTCAPRTRRVAALRHLALHLPPLAQRVAVALGQLLAVVAEQLEIAFAGGEAVITDTLEVELPLDPPHDPHPGYAVDLAGARPVGEAIQRVQGGVSGC